jgi:hypothetical protein
MSHGPALLAVLLAALPAAAGEPGCRGTLAGSVRGAFACSAAVVVRGGASYFVIEPAGPVEGVPAYAPGAFELRGKVEAGTYDLDRLGMGRASVAAEGGTLYTATKTTGRRGEVKLTLTSVRRVAGAPGAYAVRGTYRARLVPAGDGKSGEVVVEVRF